MMKNFIFSLSALFLVLTVSACSSTKETLGLNRQSPDEFAVVKRAPLSLPPNYALRPPEPGAPRPQEQATSDQAANVVFNGGAQTKSKPVSRNAAENALLTQAGANEVDPDIRRKVDQETATQTDKNKPVIDKLLSIGSKDEVPAEVLDAQEEAERLKTQKSSTEK